ncbi:Type I restriction-modification system [Salmonella enterica subsp. enterica serovar Typhi]|nr:Type I restriction-modification system [Salmonella enterica subsp. enterica serovar Typhi]CRB11703.1 Type I restriction-modification system [Salmonella enterica subsp. enterica serovar Typhi]
MNKSNFDFLKGVNDFIYAIACAAENNYPDDPNTTLIKMRMFGEATAKHLGQLLYPSAKTNMTCYANWARLRLLMTASFLFSISCAVSVTWPSTNFITIWTMPRCACGSGSASASGTTDW